MKSVIILFPGTNREYDMIDAIKLASGTTPELIWHTDTELPKTDLIIVPGGFSFGDYLRTGALAAQSPIVKEVVKETNKGVPVFGVCNGFQILVETGLLPGILIRNIHLKFICKDVELEVINNKTAFTSDYKKNQIIKVPVAHHDGNYRADEDTLKQLEDEDRIVFKYSNNPNGSCLDIAGISNKKGNILGMMPHPENAIFDYQSTTDGVGLFTSISSRL